jgi:FlaA1/EpsC-like NDP-sugar epimerase
MFWLAGSLALIMWQLEGVKVGFWRNWFLDLPVWVTPTFLLLSLSRTYVTYWPRARLRDVLMVLFWLEMGLFFSLGLALVMDPTAGAKWGLRALLIAGIGHPVIMASRLIYRCLDELVLWLKRQGDATDGAERILLYGAGVRAQLFLKDHAVRSSKLPNAGVIVGLIDDETALHFQWVYGYLVLGGLKELPHLLVRHKVSRMIIVADLEDFNRATAAQIASGSGIKLTEWHAEERPVTISPEDLISLSVPPRADASEPSPR